MSEYYHKKKVIIWNCGVFFREMILIEMKRKRDVQWYLYSQRTFESMPYLRVREWQSDCYKIRSYASQTLNFSTCSSLLSMFSSRQKIRCVVFQALFFLHFSEYKYLDGDSLELRSRLRTIVFNRRMKVPW